VRQELFRRRMARYWDFLSTLLNKTWYRLTARTSIKKINPLFLIGEYKKISIDCVEILLQKDRDEGDQNNPVGSTENNESGKYSVKIRGWGTPPAEYCTDVGLHGGSICTDAFILELVHQVVISAVAHHQGLDRKYIIKPRYVEANWTGESLAEYRLCVTVADIFISDDVDVFARDVIVEVSGVEIMRATLITYEICTLVEPHFS